MAHSASNNIMFLNFTPGINKVLFLYFVLLTLKVTSNYT